MNMKLIKKSAIAAYPGTNAKDEVCIAASRSFAADYSDSELKQIWEYGVANKWDADLTNFIAMELTARLFAA